MRFVFSLIHLLSGGIVLSALWLAASLICAIVPATRAMAGACWRLAAYNLHPLGCELVRERDLRGFQLYLRTGCQSERGSDQLSRVRLLEAAFWAPLGAVLAGAHALHGLAVSLLCFSNPWRSHSFSLLGAAVLPVGWHVVPISSGRSNFLHRSRGLPPCRPARARPPLPLKRIARSGTATAGGAVLVLWASYSATGPLILPAAAPVAPGGGSAAFALAVVQTPIPSDLYRYRPEANPPLPLGRTPHRAQQQVEGCATAAVTSELDRRLARRHTESAVPLGAAPIRPAGLHRRADALRRISRMQLLATTLRHAKVSRAHCPANLAERAVRSAAFAAREAEAARLARKAEPELILASIGPAVAQPKRRHPIAVRRLAAISRMAVLTSPAKSTVPLSVADAAARVERTAAMR